MGAIGFQCVGDFFFLRGVHWAPQDTRSKAWPGNCWLEGGTGKLDRKARSPASGRLARLYCTGVVALGQDKIGSVVRAAGIR